MKTTDQTFRTALKLERLHALLHAAVFSLCICALAFGTAACSKGRQDPQKTAVLGTEPIEDVSVSNGAAGALVHWAREGRTARTLVHFGSESGLALLPPDRAGRLKDLFRKKLWDQAEAERDIGARSLFTSANYINAAAQLGMIDEVYWVLPYKYAQYYNAEAVIRQMLAESGAGFRQEDIAGMKYADGCVSGRLSGVRTRICSPETFPPVPGPVLLDVDVGFLAAYARERRQSPLRGMKEFCDELRKRRLAVAGAHVAFTPGGMSPLAVRRYLGAQFSAVLKDVKIMEASAPPDLWSVRNDADLLFFEERFKDLAAFLREPLERYPDDAALVMFSGLGDAFLGRTGRALETLGRLCEKEKDECVGLLFAALRLEDRGQPAEARRFAAEAVRIRPAWPDALFALGNLDFRQKNYEGAIASYVPYSRMRDSLDLRMHLADSYYHLGRKKEAFEQYSLGIGLTGDMTGQDEVSRNWEALKRARMVFEEQGAADLAEKTRRLIERG